MQYSCGLVCMLKKYESRVIVFTPDLMPRIEETRG
jgi:hypothetical protein